MRNDRLKNVILVVLAICLIGLTVAFAVMSSNLNISGTASVNKSEWKIHFDNLQNPVASGSADVGTATLNGDKIILTVSDGVFKAPGDKITYIVDVVNEGDINAKVDVVSTIIGDCASEDGSDVTKYCNKIKAKLIYKDSGKEVKKDDKLNAGENKTLNLIITYDENKELTDVSSKPITIGNITSTVTYVMDDKSGDSGSDDPSKPITPTTKTAICKRAETLHTEECTYDFCANDGYTESGSKGTSTITYGNLNEDGEELVSGDAFDCDVNGDGVYDPETERFYYVSDYYDTSTGEFDSDYATLIYYNNVSEGVVSDSGLYAYDESGTNVNGPVTAIKELPSISQWSNITLKNNIRTILNDKSESTTINSSDSSTLNLTSNFSYDGYSARLLTYQEVAQNCKIGSGLNIDLSDVSAIEKLMGELSECNYLLENSMFSSPYSERVGFWLETANSTNSTSTWFIISMYEFGAAADLIPTSYSNLGIRPAIEISKSDVSYTTDSIINSSSTPIPSVKLNVYKIETEDKVLNNSWSNSYLDYKFSNIKNGDDNSKIYYCVGDDCTPNVEVENNKVTIKNDGEYKFRYYVKNSDGAVGNIKEYNARVDTIPPVVTIEGNPTELTDDIVKLTIKVDDEQTGINSVTFNGTALTLENGEASYNIGKNGTYIVVATDNVGNTTTKEVEVTNIGKAPLCARATTLHKEICAYPSCKSAGYSYGDYITYGNLETNDTLKSGDAFDCDINGDGVYDSEIERFYYVSDYYDTIYNLYDENYATLIYYNNVSGGEASSTARYAYDSDSKMNYNKYSDDNFHGPITAIKELPTLSQWSNITLKNTTRAILNEKSDNTTPDVSYWIATDNFTPIDKKNTLPNNFSYAGYAARLLTYQELTNSCGTENVTTAGYLDKFEYLMENTIYYKNGFADGYWLETASSNTLSSSWYVSATNRDLSSGYAIASMNSVRPVIDVLKSDISYSSKPSVIAEAYKAKTNEYVTSNTWSDNYLDFKFGKIKKNSGSSKIYYCIGDGCTPNIEVNENSTISIEKSGEYKFRYAVSNENGELGEIKEYSAKVDVKSPTLEVSSNPTTETVDNVLLTITSLDSESGIKNVSINGTTLDLTDGSATYTSTINGEYNIISTDKVGNVSVNVKNVTNINKDYLCKRAITLHTINSITYGNLGTNGKLTSGDAFDCDVNGDGVYDSETERFYYVSDYYDTKTRTFDNNYAALIYYKNVQEGRPDNYLYGYPYDENKTNDGPVTAIKQLPTTSQWSNVSLKSTTRAILNQMSGYTSSARNNSESYSTLKNDFSYAGYAARFLTIQEASIGCNTKMASLDSGYISKALSNCTYLLENTFYTNTQLTEGYWFENKNYYYWSNAWYVDGSDVTVLDREVTYNYTSATNSAVGVRPVIDVEKTNIDLFVSSETNLSAYKAGTTKEVESGTWSDSYLEFKFSDSENKIYYCIGNDCTPNIEVSDNLSIPSEETNTKSGEYKVRYKTENSDIYEYNAKVDVNAPIVTLEEEESDDYIETLKVNATDTESGVRRVVINGIKISIVNGVGTYNISSDGTYNVIVMDKAGNTSVQVININKKDNEVVCKRAETLHTKDTTTYGNLGTNGELTFGDAFDCDVNGDGTYDSETERFYYVSDYYDTETKTFDSNYATLIYYSNVVSGKASNLEYRYGMLAYGTSFDYKANGPVSAINALPTISQWTNVRLKTTKRELLNENGEKTTSSGSVQLADTIDYSGYAARLLTIQELTENCGITIPTYSSELNCESDGAFLNENFATYPDASGYWLENPSYEYYSRAWVYSNNRIRFETDSTNANGFGVRPVIEVKKSKISYGVDLSTKIVAYKAGTTKEINSGVWSDDYLEFKFENVDSNKVYYCIGDDCTPTTELNNDNSIPKSLTSDKDGKYKVRYKIENSNGVFSEIYQYSAKVDKTAPLITITGNPTEVTNDVVELTISISENSGVRSMYIDGEKIAVTNGIGSYKVYENGSYKIVVTDKVGNVATQIVKVSKINITPICKRATELHTEECTNTDSSHGCYSDGYSESGSEGTSTITYGNLGTSGTLTSGDAFDCDVNGDGIYDSETERFYYVNDYYDASVNLFDSDYKSLIYYSNVSGGVASNTATYDYDSSGSSINGPLTSIYSLPKISQWLNVSLKKSERGLLNGYGGKTTETTDDGKIKLASTIDYSGYAARFLTIDEIEICRPTLGSKSVSLCKYLVENTTYSTGYINNASGYWLENPSGDSSKRALSIWGSYGETWPVSVENEYYGVRPVIDVPITAISY